MSIVLPKFPRRRLPSSAAADSQPAVNLTLRCDRSGRSLFEEPRHPLDEGGEREINGIYCSGQTMKIDWRIRRYDPQSILAAELSVLWYTEGKGDEDLQVHHFVRYSQSELADRAGEVCEIVYPDSSADQESDAAEEEQSVESRSESSIEGLKRPSLDQSALAVHGDLRFGLPASPLSYQGRLVTIRWCVRLRVFRCDSSDIVTEVPFHLVAPEYMRRLVGGVCGEPRPSPAHKLNPANWAHQDTLANGRSDGAASVNAPAGIVATANTATPPSGQDAPAKGTTDAVVRQSRFRRGLQHAKRTFRGTH